MTTDLTVPAEVVDWVREHAPKDMPEHVLPTLAMFVAATDDTGRNAHASLNAVSAALGITTRKASRNVDLLRDAGLLVLVEPTDPEVLAKPPHERPKVYDLGGVLRLAMAGPERDATDHGRGDTQQDESDRMGVQGPAPDQAIPNAVHHVAADRIVRELNACGGDLFAEEFRRMIRLVAQGLCNGWQEADLLAFLMKGNYSIFKPSASLLFLMERHPRPPLSTDAIYRNEPAEPDRVAELVTLIIHRLNSPHIVLEVDQVSAARGLLAAALAGGRTSLDLMLLLEQPTTGNNPGDELLARIRRTLPRNPERTP